MNDCLNDDTLQAWMDDELSAEAAVSARSHVTQCAWCAAKAKAARQDLSLAGDAWEMELPQTILSSTLRSGLDEALAARRPRFALLSGIRSVPQLGLAATVMILVIGLTMVLRDRPDETPPLPQEAPPLMRQEGPKPDMPVQVAPDTPRPLHPDRPRIRPAEQVAAILPKPERRRVVPSETTRHLEQTQHLLRSIRNAEGEAVDWVYDVQLSRQLLNHNRLLRRRAAQKDDAFSERMLVQVEPILLDIANLAEEPDPDEIDSLRAMIRDHSIVTELQLYAARVKS